MTTTVDPFTAVVDAKISLHQAINALCELAEKYPSEKISVVDINRIYYACYKLSSRMAPVTYTPYEGVRGPGGYTERNDF